MSAEEIESRPAVGRESFDAFAQRARPQLERALAGRMPPAAVPDAVAEALAYAWEHRVRVQAMTNPVGYLYRVAQSKSRPRKQGLLPWISDAGIPDIEPGLPAALAALTPNQSEAVWLVCGAGMTQRETGEAMGISASTVANHVQRGMATLRTQLGVDQ